MNKEIIPLLKEKELELLTMYHEAYGGGGSPTRQFKSFLLTGARSKEGREIVASFRPAATVSGKEQGEQQGSASPAQQQPPQVKAKVPASLKQQGEQSQSGAGDAAGGSPFDVLKQDIETMSITGVAGKYTRDELTAYAESVGASIADSMNEKQIVKAITNKVNEGKG